jgi:thiol-disulfide isomerase/thioredoxin
MPQRSTLAPQLRTIAWVGDQPDAVVTGTPGDSISSGTAEAKRSNDREGRISGRVVDANGKPVPNARVRLAIQGAAKGRVVRTTTDASGGFTLHGLRPGASYTVIAETDDQEGLLTGRAQAQASDTQVRIRLTDLQDPPASREPGQISTVSSANEDEQEPPPDPRPRSARGSAINTEDLPPAPEAESIAPEREAVRPRRGVPRLAAPLPNSRWRRGESNQETEEPTQAAATAATPDAVPASALEEAPPPRTTRGGTETDRQPRTAAASLPFARGAVAEEAASEPMKPAARSKNTEDAPTRSTAPAPDDDGPNPLPPAIEPGKDQAPPQEPDAGASAPSPEPRGSANSTRDAGSSVAQENTANETRASPPGETQAAAASESAPVAAPPAAEAADAHPNANPAPPVAAPPAESEQTQGSPSASLPIANSPMPGLTSNAPPSAVTGVPRLADAQAPAAAAPESWEEPYNPFTLAKAGPPVFSANGAVSETAAPSPAPAESPQPKRTQRPTWGDVTSKHPELTLAMPLAGVGPGRKPVNLLRRSAAPPDQTGPSAAPAQTPAAAQAGGPPAPDAARGNSSPSNDAAALKTSCQYDARHRQLIDFRLPDLDGRPVRFQDLQADYVLLDFWGTWCGYCLQTIPHLVELQKQLGPGKLKVVGIAYEQGPPVQRAALVRDAAQKFGINYQILLGGLDGPCPLQSALQVQAYPTMVLLDRSGHVVWRDTGSTPATLSRLDRVLAANVKSELVRR